MARAHHRRGVPTTLWARRRRVARAVRGPGRRSPPTSPALGRASDVVGICVTDGAAVRDGHARARRRARRAWRAGSVLALHSTIGTDECARARRPRRRARRARDRRAGERRGRRGRGRAAHRLRRRRRRRGGPRPSGARRPTAIRCSTWVRSAAGCARSCSTTRSNAAHFALAHDALAIGDDARPRSRRSSAEALRSGSGRSFSLEVFVGLALVRRRSPTTSARSWRRTSASSRRRRGGVADRAMLLDAADRFLELLGHPRPADPTPRRARR